MLPFNSSNGVRVMLSAQSAVSMSKPGICGECLPPRSARAQTNTPEPEGAACLWFACFLLDGFGLGVSFARHGHAKSDSFFSFADLPLPFKPTVIGVEWSGCRFRRAHCSSASRAFPGEKL